VPVVVASITGGRLDVAFWLFVAGASDGVDGYIARR
jgi:phosphatidylglycerophosphate synthase